MPFIVTSILSSTVGLMWNKARDTTANKLKDGDITDAKIREIVVRELNDIKSKLDGLARKDVLSSYRFLKEGVDLLNVSLDISNDEEKAASKETQDNLAETSGILNEALELSHAIRKLKINSDKEFESAKKRFEEARKAATHAFCNEALSIKDRIFAAKLRVGSEILECLESPESAITGCLSFLRDLHSLPAIREIFSVHLNGGIKSRLNKTERMENVKSVMMINYVLYQFNFKFSRKLSETAIWPVEIELTDRSFNPIINWQEVSSRKSWGKEIMQPRNELLLDENICPYHSALNSHGEIVAATVSSADDIKVISKTGESKSVILSNPKDDKVIEHHIKGLAVDSNNNVYIVRCLETRAENGDVKSYVLNVLDETYNVKQHCTLDFLKATGHAVNVAINKNNDIIMIKNDEPYVYVCDDTGHLKHKFERDACALPRTRLSVSDNNDIMISSDNHRAVDIYTEGGNLKSTMKLPEGHKVVAVAFHYAICKIVVLSFNVETDSYFLLCYSEIGELETSTFFSKRNSGGFRPNIISHPGVPMAVVLTRRIIYI